jgi:hypothetical protein
VASAGAATVPVSGYLPPISVDEMHQISADILDTAFNRPTNHRKLRWDEGGGTGLVQWTGPMGKGLDIDITKVAKENK